jgi:hypothetical protein
MDQQITAYDRTANDTASDGLGFRRRQGPEGWSSCLDAEKTRFVAQTPHHRLRPLFKYLG